MGKYAGLIDQLNVEASEVEQRREARKTLVEADGRVLPALTHALRRHKHPSVRETVAEILGERKHWKAVPALIDALGDDCLFVRQDALWSIESICRLQPAALSMWLDLSADLDDAKSRVHEWWDANQVFIEDNPNLC
jgi:HEAT repeat protein